MRDIGYTEFGIVRTPVCSIMVHPSTYSEIKAAMEANKRIITVEDTAGGEYTFPLRDVVLAWSTVANREQHREHDAMIEEEDKLFRLNNGIVD